MTISRLIRFLLSGGMATGVHWLTLNAAQSVGVGLNYSFALGFAVALCARFLIDRGFVFQVKDQTGVIQFARYALACLLTYCLSGAFFSVAVEGAGFPQWEGFLATIILSTAIGYVLINIAFNRENVSTIKANES